MSAGNKNKPDRVDEELQRLADMSDDKIETSDISEIRDWSNAERGKFFRPDAVNQVPLYLDCEVLEFLTIRARARGIEPNDLANEMLKQDIELVRSVESG